MTTQTLTILHHQATYLAGSVFINIITNEECTLDLLISHVKPSRKRNPAIQEPGMLTHRWLWTMRHVRVIPDDVPLPNTVHNYSFDFPELNDTIYYTVLYAGIDPAQSPQAPIFACRLPLTNILSELWAAGPQTRGWNPPFFSPFNSVNYTPGRASATAQAVPGFSIGASINYGNPGSILPIPANGLFVLYDTTYIPVNDNVQSFYYFQYTLNGSNLPYQINAYEGGQWNQDPCIFFPPYVMHDFNPSLPHLFCLDFALSKLQDQCGNFLPHLDDPTLAYLSFQILQNTTVTTDPRAAILIRPLGLYRLNGPMQDISNRWKYLTGLIPQGTTPKLEQRP